MDEITSLASHFASAKNEIFKHIYKRDTTESNSAIASDSTKMTNCKEVFIKELIENVNHAAKVAIVICVINFLIVSGEIFAAFYLVKYVDYE